MTATPRVFDEDGQGQGRRGRRGAGVMDDEERLRAGVAPARLRRGRRARTCSPTTRCWSWPSTRSTSREHVPAASGRRRRRDPARRRRQARRLLERPGQELGRRRRHEASAADTAPMRTAVAFAGNIKALQAARGCSPVHRALRRPRADRRRRGPAATAGPGAARRRHVQRRSSATRSWPGSRTRSRPRACAGSCPTPGACPKASTCPPWTPCCSSPRASSVVDVVQSVGRVMRKAARQGLGYIILPVGVPAGIAAGGGAARTTSGTRSSGRSSRRCAPTTTASTRWSTRST